MLGANPSVLFWAPLLALGTSSSVQQAAGFTAFLDRESPDTVRRNPAKGISSDHKMLPFLLPSDRPGLAGKTTMLTYIQINAAKPRAKAWNLSDSQNLYLVIQPNGSKLWRFNYRFLDKQKKLHLGG